MADVANLPKDQSGMQPLSTGEGRPAPDGNAFEPDLHKLLNDLPDAILCVDRAWRITYANPEAIRISRLKGRDFYGKSHWELYPETVGTELERSYYAAMETGVAQRLRYYFAPFDLWVEVRAIPSDEGLVLYYRDITEYKRASVLRDRIAGQLKQVFEVTTDAIVGVDHTWTFSYLNRRAAELLAVKGDLVGKNLWEEFPATIHQPGFWDNYHRTMEERVPTEFEAYYPEPLNLWLSVQSLPAEDGIIVFFRDVTERRAREQALVERQELLDVVQQAALAATWEFELATGKLSFEPGSYPVFGRPFSEILTMEKFDAIVYPADLERVRQAMREALNSTAMVVMEYRVVAPDGTRLWVESRGRMVYQGGAPTHMRGMTIDVTERKRNEEALVASEARYRVLADLNPQAIWMGAPDGHITYANQGLLDYIGLTSETIGGLGWLNAFYEPDREKVLETWATSVRTGVDYDVEARMIRVRDGVARWWQLRALPVRDETGCILHWLGVGADVQDAKAAEEASHQRQEETERQRAELETVYQTAPVGLALFDPEEFRYLRLNGRQEEILGQLSAQVVGHRYDEIAPIAGLEEMFRLAAAGHCVKNQLVEGELTTRPGEHRVWNVSFTPVYAADGSIQAITAAWLEITHLKKAESALVQSEKLAAVGRLASSISHEINNPLEAITNLLYLISLSEDLPQDLKVYVHMAQAELSRVSQIATQTLRFHRQAMKPTLVTGGDLIGAVLNLYQGRLANSGIKVQAEYLTTTHVLCFENDIRQVLNNLIANAIDAMRAGGRLIARVHDAMDYMTGRRGIRLTIADTGHGMSHEVKQRMFEAFYTTKALSGTGLGLWISDGIVQRHQGRLRARSSQDTVHHGTVFSLFLPCHETPNAEGLILRS